MKRDMCLGEFLPTVGGLSVVLWPLEPPVDISVFVGPTVTLVCELPVTGGSFWPWQAKQKKKRKAKTSQICK